MKHIKDPDCYDGAFFSILLLLVTARSSINQFEEKWVW